MSHVKSFYLPLFGACMVIGGAMEMFMIQTGFYEKCVRPLPGFSSAPNHTLTLTRTLQSYCN